MNHTSFTLIKFLLLFVLVLPFAQSRAQQTDFCNRANMIVKTAQKHHFSPRPVDDQFAELVVNNFIDKIDYYSIYFTKQELEQLKEAKKYIVNDLMKSKCNFLSVASQLFTAQVSEVDSILQSFQSVPIDLYLEDSITFGNNTFAADDAQLMVKWRKLVKLNMLSSHFAKVDSTGKIGKPNDSEIEELRHSAISQESCRLKSMYNHEGGIEGYIGNVYLQSVVEAFDPHSSYLTVDEKDAYNDMLSKQKYSFGFEIDRNDRGEIIIIQINPGSPAWNSRLLNEGDVIMKIKANGHEKLFDCISMQEAVSYLSSAELANANFTIKKESGKQINLDLQKDNTEVEENVIKSFLLEGKTRVGYIYLPSFYTQIEGDYFSTHGCANDLAKELIKLKKEEIKGLIIDLRDNGGGSMLEAILMSGIFIDYGAVGISAYRNEEPQTLKDMNKGIIYDAPLIILISEFSASASEFFAASMQDQNRALIVGSPSYGKSTMQSIMPVNAYKYNDLDGYMAEAPAYLKLTIGAFYRVTGQSHQKTGIVPDVSLPSLYSEFNFGERSYPSALDAAPVTKKTYYYPQQALPIEELKQLSLTRTTNSTVFEKIRKRSINIAQYQQNYTVALGYEHFDLDHLNDLLEPEIVVQDSVYTVKNPSYFDAVSTLSDTKLKLNKNAMTQIKGDPYVLEGYHIMNDLIEMNLK